MTTTTTKPLLTDASVLKLATARAKMNQAMALIKEVYGIEVHSPARAEDPENHNPCDCLEDAASMLEDADFYVKEAQGIPQC